MQASNGLNNLGGLNSLGGIGTGIGINALLNGTVSLYTLITYYIGWSVLSIISGWFVTFTAYLWIWVTPRVVQSFYINDKSNPVLTGRIYGILAFIAETNPNSFNKDYAPADIDGDRESNISPGTYIVKYSGWYVMMTLTRAQSSSDLMMHSPTGTTLSMWTLSLNRGFFDSVIKDSEKMLQKTRSIYVYGGSNGYMQIRHQDQSPWTRHGTIEKRRWSNTIITEENMHSLNDAIRRFQSRPQKEIDMEIPHKLCILLSGPPGFGKTTLIKATAHEHQLNLYSTSLGLMSAEGMNTISHGIRPRSILVFEDVDCMVNDRAETQKPPEPMDQAATLRAMLGHRTKTGVPLSSFLNMLDGLTTSSEYIIIMTTNYPERLDDALARSERVNLHLKLEPDPELYSRMFRRFFPEVECYSAEIPPRSIIDSNVTFSIPNGIVDKFAEECTRRKLSLADLQAHFRRHITDPISALKLVECAVGTVTTKSTLTIPTESTLTIPTESTKTENIGITNYADTVSEFSEFDPI